MNSITDKNTRRDFLRTTVAGIAVGALTLKLSDRIWAETVGNELPFKISLAQWSLHRPLFAKKLDNLDFAKVARNEFDIEGVEYVSLFFKDKAKDQAYLKEMKKIASDHGVTSLLIMVEGEHILGDPSEEKRLQTVDDYKKWVDAAVFLGCHSLRVNAGSSGSYEEQQKLAADGIRRLCDYAKPMGLNILVENHGGLSSNGKWLAKTIAMVDRDNCGTLPDFGNWSINHKTNEVYDRYLGMSELMPFAKAVSAKGYGFDSNGNETATDYRKVMKIVLEAGYRGWVGIEWEGTEPDEYEGIRLTKKLLERIRQEIEG